MLKIKPNEKVKLTATITERAVIAHIEENATEAYIKLEYSLDFETSGDEYVLFPACCYNGNRFDVLKKNYPPLFDPNEASVNMPVTITDVPRLNKDGSGIIEVTAGDVSVPCVGVFSKEKKQAILLFTVQEIDGINLGLSYQKGKIGITYPHMRSKIYRWPFMTDSRDMGIDFTKGQRIEIPYKILSFACEDVIEFYEVFFTNRKCMGLDNARPVVLPPNQQFEILRNKFNALNWREAGGFYGVGTTDEPSQTWQPGWVGGGISSYALMKLGGALEWERGVSTLRHLFKTQAASGFFHESADENGHVRYMDFGIPGTENWHLIRKSADALYFAFKHFDLFKEKNLEVPQEIIKDAKKTADAFVRLWEKYAQFGQFVDLETGDIAVGDSTCAAIASAALVSAYRFFGDDKYLEAAEKSAELHYTRDAQNGYTTGGPGEILQCPDSESAFGLLESLIKLYELNGKEKWLDYARHAAHMCGSWVVAYNYRFPRGSEFARLNMKTVGSVFANAQNKHSAPGICTLSGDSLFKLYTYTQNELYLDLLKDISLTINQYMSTDERPIYSWDVKKDASLLQTGDVKAEREKLAQGFICERVNMSDWEGERCVGGVFNGSCWSETANLLTLAEVSDFIKDY